MQIIFFREYDGGGNIGDDRNGAGLHRESIHGFVLQPHADVGKLSPWFLPNHAPHLLPVSSCSDGWRRGCRISGVIASHHQVLAITPRLNLNSIGLTPCFLLNAVQK